MVKELKDVIAQIFSHPDRFGELLGYRVETAKPGEALVSLVMREDFQSPSGMVHGGVLSAFVDFAMGAAIFTKIKKGQMCSTIEFKVNYLSPVKLGETVFALSKIKFYGKSHAVVDCHVFREHDERREIALALGTYNIY